ncbi:Fis family transcriptional regulator [Sulfurifustis variabilis]|uniref:Fis family transcriptional regulator n=1 Tax=Sulfurifustis variabilis TaxID=1675686 RepID=A0A1B4UZP5_9GAMM|nr:YifB family Mg chelatase-like AAA ATPase [Sulfurifustis variabilis]BAU46619.1 Fis family transcriptional regulator [Sulfurifustis variabilis]
MGLAVVHSRAQVGIEAPAVTVEVHLANGLPSLSIVGLPEAAVKEAKDRVRAALLNARFEFPARRITINLAPADLPKEGARFDLPIALGILAASEQIPGSALAGHEFIGELALTGELRPVRGALSASLAARSEPRALVVPEPNAPEAALVDGVRVLGARHLLEVTAHFAAERHLVASQATKPPASRGEAADLGDIRGQHQAKRALEIAAAGAHSLLLVGPPGTGKTMLASRLPGILPPLTDHEALEVAAIHSAYKGFTVAQWKERPFRAPHHTASGVALVGGGSHPRPGEISLAHHGVLFLDELPEFDRSVLEVLREPLESGTITISRAARQAEFPARFQLVAAMNPCPCGHHGDTSGRCRCTEERIRTYRARVSGPLLDRIDMHVEVPSVPRDVLLSRTAAAAEGSQSVQARVTAARERQLARSGCANQTLSNKQVDEFCRIDTACQQLLEQAMLRLRLSARAYHRILKVARTIADLAGEENIRPEHLAEAIQYRAMDRPGV